MHSFQPSPRDEEEGRGDDPAPRRQDASPPDYSPSLPDRHAAAIPPPPVPPPPSYYSPVDSPGSAGGDAAPSPWDRYGPAGPYGGSGSYPDARQGGYPPPPVPVEQLYSEPRPQRKWLRIPLDRPIFTFITLGILLAFYLPVMLSEQTANALYGFGWKENSLIVEGEWWRLITSTLLHGPLYHIFFNGYALFMLGSDLESFFNRWRFLAIYWLSALGGSVASFAFSPVPSVGASGAIFGLIGALAVYFGLHRGLFGRIGQAQFWNILVVIVLNVGIGLSRIFPIDNAAHIGGLVVGAAAGYVLCPRYALADWRFPNVRDIRDTNRGSLTWIAFTLIALDVIFAFFVALLMYQKGYWTL